MNATPDKLYYSLENVWRNISPAQADDVLSFWEKNGLQIDELNLRQRARQAVFIARNLKQNVIGVCTVYKSFNKRLNNYVYNFRTLITPDSRHMGIAIDLLKKTRDFFNHRFKEKTDTDCIGLMFTIENPEIAATFKQAVWPRTGFIFLGYNKKGQQIRIFYFDNANI